MIGTVGQRVELRGLKLMQKTWYEKEIGGYEKRTVVVWRYAFLSPDNQRIVYSGNFLAIVDADLPIDLRATIKRHDTEYNLTRISRPRILEPEKRQGKLI